MRHRNRLLLAFVLGLLLGTLWREDAAVAQVAQRMFGTLSTGATQAVIVDSNGAVQVKGN